MLNMKVALLKCNIVYRNIPMHVKSISTTNLKGMVIEMIETIPFNLFGITIERNRKRYFYRPLKNSVHKHTLNVAGVTGDYANVWVILKSKPKTNLDLEPIESLDSKSKMFEFLDFQFKINK